jgi:penicillin-binding protein 1C
VTLLELAELYGTLARQGNRRDLRVLQSAECNEGCSVLSREAAYLTLQELVKVERPALARIWRTGRDQVPIPWKTGTSYGHQDAWSVGIAGPYVVAVWLGNFTGAGVPYLSGREAAAPLLFDLIGLLPRERTGHWHDQPPGLDSRSVCTLSGAPPTALCPVTREADYIPGISPGQPCDLHRRLEVDRRNGHTVCSRCRTAGATEERTVVWWPPRVAGYLTANGHSEPAVPSHHPDCPVFGRREPPRIVSPLAGLEYHLRHGTPAADQRLALTASVSQGCHELYWFVDGTLYWKGEPGSKVFWDPSPGRHRITLKDDAGQTDVATFDVVGP